MLKSNLRHCTLVLLYLWRISYFKFTDLFNTHTCMHALPFDLSRMFTFTLFHSSLSPFSDLCRQPGEIHPLACKIPPATDRPLQKWEMERDDWQGLHELEGPCLSTAAERSRLIKIDRRSYSLSPSQRHSSGVLAVVLIFPTAALVFQGLCAEIDSWALLFLTSWCRHVDATPPTTAAPQLGTIFAFTLKTCSTLQVSNTTHKKL